jgi:hypothetical protein
MMGLLAALIVGQVPRKRVRHAVARATDVTEVTDRRFHILVASHPPRSAPAVSRTDLNLGLSRHTFTLGHANETAILDTGVGSPQLGWWWLHCSQATGSR